MAIKLTINGKETKLDIDPQMPLLWAIRDHLNLMGTKFGCGLAQCGACTIQLNGTPIRSCVTPVAAAENQSITTIEGLQGKVHKAVADAWEEQAVYQCGYCQSGQIVSAVALLTQNPKPNDQDIDNYMSGNICRCATYVRIRKAIKIAAKNLQGALS